MVVTNQSRNRLVLRPPAGEVSAWQAGDNLVVERIENGSIVLTRVGQPRRSNRSGRAFLTPPPLSLQVRRRLYRSRDSAWDRVEAAAVAHSRARLAGARLEDL